MGIMESQYARIGAVSFLYFNLNICKLVQPIVSSSDVNRISQMKRRFPWECIRGGRHLFWTLIWQEIDAKNKKKKSCMKNSQKARVSFIFKLEVRLRVCMWVCVFLSEFFISVNLCNYAPTEGGIKASFICWDDEYDSGLLYRLHICRQTHINLRP